MAYGPHLRKKVIKEKSHCSICGANHIRPDVCHIIDKREWCEKVGAEQIINAIPLCPNCHRMFDEQLRPHLHQALTVFGVIGLPSSWSKSNKVTEKQAVIA